MARKKTRSEISRELAAEAAVGTPAPETVAADIEIAEWCGFGKTVTILAAASLLVFLILAFSYGHFAGGFVAGLDSGLGQVLAGRGARLEAAGEHEGAIKCLEEAVNLPFSSAKDRLFTVKRLGALLITTGNDVDGVKWLGECVSSPDHPISAFLPLIAALNRLKRYDESVKYADAWIREAEEAKLASQVAEGYRMKGLAFLGKEDNASALESFVEGEKREPGGANAFEAARILNAMGRSAEALPYLDKFIGVGTDTRTSEARKMRDAMNSGK